MERQFVVIYQMLKDRSAVLRRSEPSSRTALTGEQTDPWEVLPPQDAVQPFSYYYKG